MSRILSIAWRHVRSVLRRTWRYILVAVLVAGAVANYMDRPDPPARAGADSGGQLRRVPSVERTTSAPPVQSAPAEPVSVPPVVRVDTGVWGATSGGAPPSREEWSSATADLRAQHEDLLRRREAVGSAERAPTAGRRSGAHAPTRRRYVHPPSAPRPRQPAQQAGGVPTSDRYLTCGEFPPGQYSADGVVEIYAKRGHILVVVGDQLPSVVMETGANKRVVLTDGTQMTLPLVAMGQTCYFTPRPSGYTTLTLVQFEGSERSGLRLARVKVVTGLWAGEDIAGRRFDAEDGSYMLTSLSPMTRWLRSFAQL